jgi:hypothetical protein
LVGDRLGSPAALSLWWVARLGERPSFQRGLGAVMTMVPFVAGCAAWSYFSLHGVL